MLEKLVERDVMDSLARLRKAGTVYTTPPEIALFSSHTPFELTVPVSAIKNGFTRSSMNCMATGTPTTPVPLFKLTMRRPSGNIPVPSLIRLRGAKLIPSFGVARGLFLSPVQQYLILVGIMIT
jgi:hypothetical protein